MKIPNIESMKLEELDALEKREAGQNRQAGRKDFCDIQLKAAKNVIEIIGAEPGPKGF